MSETEDLDELKGRVEKLTEFLAEAERASAACLDVTKTRIAELEAQNRKNGDTFDELSSGYLARAETAEARIAKALAILSEPGMWSDFAARAKAALRGE